MGNGAGARARIAALGLIMMLAAAAAAGASRAEALPLCKLVTTGGTIAMRPAEPGGAPVPADSGEALLAAVPELAEIARIDVENLFNVPSPHMNPERWIALQRSVAAALEDPEVAGVIVSHGTDTLEESAFFLDLTLRTEKPVVLTGALRDAASADFDGPRNLRAAARICAHPEAGARGTMLVMDDVIHAAREVRKGHTARGGFHSGAAGALGVVDADRVRMLRWPEWRQHIALPEAAVLPQVDMVMMYPGASGTLLEQAVAAGARGIVVQALGLGNVNPALAAAIRDAVAGGVPVVITSRVQQGAVAPVYGYDGGGAELADAGAIFAGDLLPQKARILLMLALQHTRDPDALQAHFGG